MLGKELLLVGMLMGVPHEEITCLTENMYYEARNQSFAGLLAVTNVVMNRVADDRFPDTVCEVVKQGPVRPSWKGTGEMIPVRNRCQFSWWCDGKPETITDKEAYEWAEEISWGLLDGTLAVIDLTDGATHYHAYWVKPSWSERFTQTVRINDHIFYRREME